MEISTVFSAMILAALGDALWWLLADARLRGMRHAGLWRVGVALFVLSQLAYVFICIFAPSTVRPSVSPIPMGFQILTYIWHLAVLPILGAWGIAKMARRLIRWYRRRGARPQPVTTGAVENSAIPTEYSATTSRRFEPSRRQMLSYAAAAVPPIVAASVAGMAVVRLDGLRVRRFSLTLPTLPRVFDGMTIAQVTDTHIGKFLHADRLPGIAEQVNSLDADFVVFTGDLIDADLDDLPLGLDFLDRLKPRAGLVTIEGNHDLIDDRGEFERRMSDSGLPFLVGSQLTLPFRGDHLQFLGVPWNPKDPLMADSVEQILPQVHKEAFPILLAHHPHCFDRAADAGLPLILSGHTHGGQIMLNPHLGAGSLRFRYTSGLYQKARSSLLVCNGIGNWFPVRINAPAEILHITLKSI